MVRKQALNQAWVKLSELGQHGKVARHWDELAKGYLGLEDGLVMGDIATRHCSGMTEAHQTPSGYK